MHTLTPPTNTVAANPWTGLWVLPRTAFGDRHVRRFWNRVTGLSGSGTPCVVETTPLDAAPVWDEFLVNVAAVEAEGTTTTSLRLAALTACDDLRKLVSLSDTRIAEIVGISRNTIGNWRNSSCEPYPSTVRNLLTVHGMVTAYRRRFGEEQAALWFNENIESFSTDEGLETLVFDLRRLLLPQRPSALNDIDDEPPADEVVIRLAEFSGDLLADDATFV